MSKPKKGYVRWSIDLKEKTAERIRIKAAKTKPAKNICEELIETHFKKG